jgi:hypothetical protein
MLRGAVSQRVEMLWGASATAPEFFAACRDRTDRERMAMSKLMAVFFLTLALLIGAAAPGLASRGGFQGGFHGGPHPGFHGGFHPGFRSHVFIGVGPSWWGPVYWGPPYWWGPAYFYDPYSYYYPSPYYAFPPLAVEQPPIYVQQQPATTQSPPQAIWYYCGSAKAFYPKISDCPEAWIKVPPTP